jgi:CPA1 family monovalent cation:H+ antiporter
MPAEIVTFTLLVAATALFLQDRARIPTPITMIVLVLIAKAAGYGPVTISDRYFDQVITLLLPVLICVDAMALRWSEVRANALALAYLAGIMVLLSIGAAILLARNILPDYHLDVAGVTALFCMIAATDPISVSSVFGRIHLPHGLKVLAEGESLFNDGTALILFSLALTALGPGHATIESVPTYALVVVASALGIGLATGYAGLWVLSVVHNAAAESFIVLAMAFSAYGLAERAGGSGILAVIVAVLFANHIITTRIESDPDLDGGVERPALSRFDRVRRILIDFETLQKETTAYQIVLGNLQFAAILAASIVFVSMAALVRIDLLMRYKTEIVSVFVGISLIRILMLGLFAGLGRFWGPMPRVPLHWWMVLCAAGVRGAISLLMLHAIPESYAYRELFEAIVVGNVLLSTFVYPPAMLVIAWAYRTVFEHEYACDHLKIEE